MRSLITRALMLLALTGAPALGQKLTADARFSVSGIADADTGAIFAAVRSGLQADSTVRLVWRPANMAAARGQELEVAHYIFAIMVNSTGGIQRISFRVFDVSSNQLLGSSSVTVPAGESIATVASNAARAFVKSARWPAK